MSCSTTTINTVPSVTLRAECERRAVCPECGIVVDLAPLKPWRFSERLEFYECVVCSIGSTREAWEKNLVTVKRSSPT